MKGFLYRIAASARGENARVHPMVRPLFAHDDAASETQPAIEAGVERPRGGVEAAEVPPVREATSRMSGIRAGGEARDRMDDGVSRPLFAERSMPQMRWSSEAREGKVRDELRFAATRERDDAQTASRVERIERTEVRVLREESARSATAVDEYRPLVTAAPKREAEVQREQPFVLPQVPVLPPGPLQRGVMKNAREANGGKVRETPPVLDRIEIHIERIEVTAVTEAPPVRVAARPQRHGQTLDEYLRGGSERRMG